MILSKLKFYNTKKIKIIIHYLIIFQDDNMKVKK